MKEFILAAHRGNFFSLVQSPLLGIDLCFLHLSNSVINTVATYFPCYFETCSKRRQRTEPTGGVLMAELTVNSKFTINSI